MACIRSAPAGQEVEEVRFFAPARQNRHRAQPCRRHLPSGSRVDFERRLPIVLVESQVEATGLLQIPVFGPALMGGEAGACGAPLGAKRQLGIGRIRNWERRRPGYSVR
jgi:hypothetical protein